MEEQNATPAQEHIPVQEMEKFKGMMLEHTKQVGELKTTEERLTFLMEKQREYDALPVEERELAQRMMINRNLKLIGEFWDKLDRKGKRRATAKHMKSSYRLTSILKKVDSDARKAKKEQEESE